MFKTWNNSLEQNPSLKIANDRLRQSQALLGTINAQRLPHIGVNPSVYPYRSLSGKKYSSYNDITMPLFFNWEIDIFGKLSDKVQSGRYDVKIAKEDVNIQKLSLTSEVCAMYFNIILTDELIENEEEILKNLNEVLKLKKQLYEGGIIKYDDLYITEYEKINTQTELNSLYKQRDILSHAFSFIRAGASKENINHKTMEETVLPFLPDAEINSDLIFNRPDVMQAEYAIKKAAFDVKVAKKMFLPSFNLNEIAGFESFRAGRLLNWDSIVYQLGAGLLLAIFFTPTDIFPEINTPAVVAVWNYNGMPAKDVENRIVSIAERAYSANMNDVEHIESQSLYGVGVIKVFLHPGADVNTAITQLSSASQVALNNMPLGIRPPQVIKYTPTTIPVLQVVVSSKKIPLLDVSDLAQNIIKVQMSKIEGSQIPLPMGGLSRQIMVDLDMQKMEARALTPLAVTDTLAEQNVILPSGNVKVGGFGTDSVVLNKGSISRINFKGVSSEEQIKAVKIGNDVILKVYDESGDNKYGEVKLLNYVKNPIGVKVYKNDEYIDDVTYMQVGSEAVSAKTYGAIADDTIFSSRAKNTFVESYNSWGYLGYDVISSRKGAVDTIKISALDKSYGEITAYSMDFDYYKDEDSDKKVLEIYLKNGESTIKYKQYDANGDVDVDLSKVKLIDSAGTKYSFFEATSLNTNLAKICGKTNNIVFSGVDESAAKGLTFTDSKKSDFIYGSDKADGFIYQNGGLDVFNGGLGVSEGSNGSDTYTVANFNKKSQLMVLDYDTGDHDDNDTLIFANNDVSDLRLLFDVDKDGNVGDGWNLCFVNKDSMSNTKGVIKEFFKGIMHGSVEIFRYFSSNEPTTELAGGYIENVFTKDHAETTGGLNMADWIDKVAFDVATWLSYHQNYETSFDVIRAGNKVDVESLLRVYSAADYQSSIV